jgi:hypothetical protein
MPTRAGKLAELTPDQHNANRHTERGTGMLEKSLRKFGAGRSILVDKAGKVIAGNGVLEGAASIGLEDVLIVQTDGKQLVAVQRTDLDPDSPEARSLAIADNRTAEVGLDWDPAALSDLAAETDLSDWFGGDELAALIAQPADEGDAEIEELSDWLESMGSKAPLKPAWAVVLCERDLMSRVRQALEAIPGVALETSV